jgi:hypothetical protein
MASGATLRYYTEPFSALKVELNSRGHPWRRIGKQRRHAYFLERLVPVCAALLDACVAAGEIQTGTGAQDLLRAVGNLCGGIEHNPSYNTRHMVGLLIGGLLQ